MYTQNLRFTKKIYNGEMKKKHSLFSLTPSKIILNRPIRKLVTNIKVQEYIYEIDINKENAEMELALYTTYL